MIGPPTKANPFGVYSKPAPPAKPLSVVERTTSPIPNLTQHVALAREARIAGAHAGLLPPADLHTVAHAKAAIAQTIEQRKAAAATLIAKMATHAPPTQSMTGLLAAATHAPRAPRIAIGAPPAPPLNFDIGGPYGGPSAPLSPPAPRVVDPSRPGFFMSQEPAGTYGASHFSTEGALKTLTGNKSINSAIGQAIPQAFANMPGLGVAAELNTQPGRDAVKAISQEGKQLANPGAPHSPVAFLSLNTKTQAALTKLGYKKGNVIYNDDLAKLYGTGYLGTTIRKLMGDAATKNGWPASQIPTTDDPTLAYRAVTPFHPSLFGFAQNFAGDIGNLTASVNTIPMVASAMTRAAEHQSIQPIAQLGGQFVQQEVNHLPGFGNMPLWENAYFQPMSTAMANAPIVKGLGLRAGILADKLGAPGLSGTRDVTLPTTSIEGRTHTVTVPTTRNVLSRPVVSAVDRLLTHSVHPNERAVGAPGATGKAAMAVQRLGHYIERKQYLEPAAEHMLTQAKLEVESGPRLKLNDYLKMIKGIPTTKRDLIPIGHRVEEGGKISDKQGRAETIIRHAAVNTHSADLAKFYRTLESRNTIESLKLGGHAETERELAAAAKGAGDEEAAKNHEAVAAEHDANAAHLKNVARDQGTQATYSEKNPVNLDALSPREQRLAASAREVSQEATIVKARAGKLGDTGASWGDLQHRIHILSVLEGRASESPTAMGHAADAVLQARAEAKALEEKLQETAKTHGQGGLSSASGPAARAALAKVRAIEPILRDVKDRLSAAAARHVRSDQTTDRRASKGVVVSTHSDPEAAHAAAAQFQADHPGYEARSFAVTRKGTPGFEVQARPSEAFQTPAEAAAARARITPGALRTIQQAAVRALNLKKENHGKIVAVEARSADRLEAVERAKHEGVAGERLKTAQREMNAINFKAERLKRPPTDKQMEEATAKLEAAKSFHEHGFMPSEKLAAQQTRATRLATELSGMELSPSEMAEVANLHLKPAELAAVNKVELEHAIHAAAHGGSALELNRLHEKLTAEHARLSSSYEAFSGSSAEAALRHEEAVKRYAETLKTFDQADSHNTGRNPFHIAMRMPGERPRTMPVRESHSEQFNEGNYTPDLHIELARDLEGHTKLAVEQRLFQKISASPYVIENAREHSTVPPGFIQVDKEILTALRKPFRNADEAKDVMEKWVAAGKRRGPGETVKGANSSVLVSRDMHDWITQTLRSPNPGLASGLLDFTNAYRRWMLFTLPRTLVNNAVGNPILAMMGGAGIMDYIRAIRMLNDHPELIPVVERHRGPLANALQSMKLTSYQAFWRDKNVYHEDLGRLTVYMHHAIKQFKDDSGIKFYQKVDMASTEMTNYLKDLADGKNPDVHKFIKFADDWFGNMAKVGKHDRAWATAVLFHKWVAHMINLTLWRMPTKYPGRTAMLYNLSNMANDYRDRHGQWPSWASGLMVLFHRTQNTILGPQTVGYGLNSGGWSPFATPGQSINLGTEGQPNGLFQSMAAANANPVIRLFLETISGKRLDTLGDFKDSAGNTLGPLDPGVMFQSAVSQTPVLGTGFPRGGLASNASQLPLSWVPGLGFLNSGQHSYSAAGSEDPSLRPPSAYHHGVLLDIAARLAAMGGLSPGVVDEGGARARENAAIEQSAIFKAQSVAAGKQAKLALAAKLAHK